MPSVPYSPIPTVTPSPSSGLPYQNAAGATPEAFGANIGQAEQGLGNKIEQFGDVLQKHADFLQQRNNQAEADQGFVDNAAKIAELKANFNSLEGKNANIEAYNKYVSELGKIRDSALGNLSNPEAKRMFEREFNRRLVFDIEGGASHVATQQRAFQKTSSAAIVTIAKQDSALNPEDDARFKVNTDTIKNKVNEQGFSDGWSSERIEVERRRQVGDAWNERLTGLSRTDPLRARDLLEKNKNELDGITYDKITRSVNQGIVQVQSRIDADKIVSGGFGISNDLVENVKKLEGFEPKAKWDYKQFTSGYGTRAGAAGEPIDQVSAEKRLREELGRAAQIVDQVNPNLPTGTRDALISLTFNAGGDWIKSGLGEKIRAGDLEGAQANFAQYTQAGGQQNSGLVTRRAIEATWWGGTSRSGSTAELQTSALLAIPKRAEELFPNDPGNRATYEDTLRQRVNSEFAGLKTGILAVQRETMNTVNSEILNPDKPIISLDQLSIQAQDAYRRLPDIDQVKVRRQLVRNAAADPNPQSEETEANYHRLLGLAGDPASREDFANLNLLDEKLTRTRMNELVKKQINLKNIGQEDLKMAKVMSDVRAQLDAAGIGPSKSDKSKADQYYLFHGQMQDAVKDFEIQNKRIPNPKESEEIAGKLLRDVELKRWYWNTTERAFERTIPDADKVLHTTEFKKRLGREPTPIELQIIYRRALERKPNE